jgi:undecaprenyl-diphosphatase
VTPILQAIVLGIVEGLTEFLPISSTGHLIVAANLIRYRDAAATFTVVIQIGAILAVVWFYRHDLIRRIAGLFGGRPAALRFWLNLVIATIPAGVLGLALENTIEARLLTPVTVAISLIVGGVILWIVESRPRPVTTPRAVGAASATDGLDAMTPRQALLVGLAQTLALVPGVSRSGASIVGGLLTGLDRPTATAFSFYLGIPILGLAGLYKLYKARDALSSVPGGGAALLVGTAVAFVTALLAVGWLLRYISRHDFRGFAVYRVIAGIVILLLAAVGVITTAF